MSGIGPKITVSMQTVGLYLYLVENHIIPLIHFSLPLLFFLSTLLSVVDSNYID
jgi:hypothetical protein